MYFYFPPSIALLIALLALLRKIDYIDKYIALK